ncbi:hypothetical protein EJB05_06987, partial [Eragrostis curvula]
MTSSPGVEMAGAIERSATYHPMEAAADANRAALSTLILLRELCGAPKRERCCVVSSSSTVLGLCVVARLIASN